MNANITSNTSVPGQSETQVESNDEESSVEKGSAPLELLAEFLQAVMAKKYKMAHKLCQMILMFEPENPQAKEFSPLLEKMVELAEENNLNNEETESSEESEEGESDEESSEESSNAASDSSEDKTIS
ncbi:hypothetical protein GDO86_016899 [Hymenochirus boettgeri]|uniref:Glutamate-rich 2 n=1 Tax=Hymenochirus boettgeri TaxID=247094 RepID=A0A8T2IMX5_9PIPI|nr:hypothetical protein GDO86_016899 [Hymenochirus boettgeri]